MRILALDTATERCSAALLVEGEIIDRSAHAPQQHASLLLPWINELIAEAGIGRAALDAVAISAGPGSFTGIRIGFAVAQGIALAAGIGLVPISTLEVLAAGTAAPGGTAVLAVLDARLGQVYAGGYRRQGAGRQETLLPDRVCDPQALVTAAAGRSWLGAGPGMAAHDQALSGIELIGRKADCWPQAAVLARLAAARLASGTDAQAPEQAQPIYLRDRVTG